DSEGNAADEVIRTVIVQDTGMPVILLSGDNPQYVEVHTPYLEAGATVNDSYDTNLTATIDSSEVNT
ncbi:MAG: hypothetical protein LBU27_05650, partial [Candidatus Peribacteria bacterium]|nr:hypothetical protein [Candidatus Peribacteria bacterium]